MCWSKIKAKVTKDGYIKPAIFETEWNRWYILMLCRGEVEMDEKCLAEERASKNPREDYVQTLEKDLRACKAIIREREFYGRIASFNPFPWIWKKIFGN